MRPPCRRHLALGTDRFSSRGQRNSPLAPSFKLQASSFKQTWPWGVWVMFSRTPDCGNSVFFSCGCACWLAGLRSLSGDQPSFPLVLRTPGLLNPDIFRSTPLQPYLTSSVWAATYLFCFGTTYIRNDLKRPSLVRLRTKQNPTNACHCRHDA